MMLPIHSDSFFRIAQCAWCCVVLHRRTPDMANNPFLYILHDESTSIPLFALLTGDTLGGSRFTAVSVDSFAFIIAAKRAGGARRLGLSEVTGITITASILKFERVFKREFRYQNRLALRMDRRHSDFCHPGNSSRMAPTTHHYHKKILKLAKGFRGRQKNCYTIAVRSVIKAQSRAFGLELPA